MKKEKNKGCDAMHCIIYYFPIYDKITKQQQQ